MTGTVAATVVVTAAASVAVATTPCALALTVMMGAAGLVIALPDVGVDVVPESALPVPDGPGGGESGCELAAMAAAAIASGAVAPEVGAVVGALVAGVVVGIATATGVGGVVSPACCTKRVVSTAVAASTSSCRSLDGSLDFGSAGFEGVEAVVVDWLVLLPAAPFELEFVLELELELASDGGPAFAELLELSPAGGFEALLLTLLSVVLALLLAAAALLAGGGASELFCAGGGGGGGESFGVFWLTRFPNKSFADGGLDRVSHEGAAWNAALLATESGVALTTDVSNKGTHLPVSKDRAMAGIRK